MSLPTGTEPTFGDYLALLRRRGGLLGVVVALTVLVGVLVAYRVPPVYGSTGILIAEPPEIPEHVVRSTVPENPEDRVRIITQRVLTNANFEKIIAEQNLYREAADRPSDAIQTFRDHLALGAEDPEILESLLGPSRAAEAMAFSLTFTDSSPVVARDVARRLVALYLEENQRARSEQAAETTRFLEAEVQRIETDIEARERRLAAFKSEHAGSLPDDRNNELAERTRRDVELVDQEIRSLRSRRDLAYSALALLSPNATVVDESGRAVLGDEERRTLLERRYAELTSIYTEDHPDVQKIRRELETLGGAPSAAVGDEQALRTELAAREDELAAARTRYSADHPDVLRLERTIDGLKAALDRGAAEVRAAARAPDNPQYIQRQVQLKATQGDLDAALARRRELTARLAELERGEAATPEVERALAALSRGYEQRLTEYADVQGRLREAQMAANLESEGRGDRFTVLQTPFLPTAPLEPNRIAVLLLTLFAALAIGAGTVAIAERSDPTVRHPRDVAEHFGAPPIVAIPYVFNSADASRAAKRRFAAITLGCLWVGTIIFLVMTPA